MVRDFTGITSFLGPLLASQKVSFLVYLVLLWWNSLFSLEYPSHLPRTNFLLTTRIPQILWYERECTQEPEAKPVESSQGCPDLSHQHPDQLEKMCLLCGSWWQDKLWILTMIKECCKWFMLEMKCHWLSWGSWPLKNLWQSPKSETSDLKWLSLTSFWKVPGGKEYKRSLVSPCDGA